MKNRITPENIRMLDVDDVFVFGSNEMGNHAGGAAFDAWTKWGAKNGVGFGHMGQTFAIPSLDWQWAKLSLHNIGFYVRRFIEYAKRESDLQFYVTKIGCGIAGYSIQEIAPLFRRAKHVKNIHLPKEFWEVLNEKKSKSSSHGGYSKDESLDQRLQVIQEENDTD